jgi:sugar/nucleoside kinase (ribokinase family)
MANILCAGIAAVDEVFRVRAVPMPDTKVAASEFITVSGGCAASGALAIARLGGKAYFAGPLGGPAGGDEIGDHLVDGLQRDVVECIGCVRVSGARTTVSVILVDDRGDRTIATFRDHRLDEATVEDPDWLVSAADAVLVDNCFPNFAVPICRAAMARRIPVVVDADHPADDRQPLFRTATHVIFSADCLRATSRVDDLAAGLAHMGKLTDAFLAVTNGASPVLWHDRDCATIRKMPVFAINAVDTLGAGDVFHGAFVLAFVEGRSAESALRFAAAAAGLKCSRFGGSSKAPRRAEVEALLAQP